MSDEVHYDCFGVAGWLGVHTRTIWKWYDAGRLRGRRDKETKVRMVSRSSLLELCEACDFRLPADIAGDAP